MNQHNFSKENLRLQILELVATYCDKYLNHEIVPGRDMIQAAGKVIDKSEVSNIVDSALDGWLTAGKFNALFEKKLAEFIGINHVMTVNSGSSANLIAFSTLTSESLGDKAIKKGDEVISVAAGFPTTVNPILQFGAIPVFVDVNLGTYNIDTSQVEKAITSKTKAIMLAHSLGNPFDLETIKKLCNKYDLWLIEDCCDALGSTYLGKKVGTFGDISTLSFYPAHHITMGEGGAVFTNNHKLKVIAESFRDWGRDCYCNPGKDNTCGKRFCQKLGDLPNGYDHKFTYSHLGYNLKISDMQAACGLAQLDKLTKFIEKRRSNFAYLHKKLQSCREYLLLPEATEKSDPSWFGFPITLKKEANTQRVDLLTYLDQKKIGTRLFFGGNLTRQPYMKNQTYRVVGDLVNTNYILENTFWIGLYPGINESILDYVVEHIETYFGLNF